MSRTKLVAVETLQPGDVVVRPSALSESTSGRLIVKSAERVDARSKPSTRGRWVLIRWSNQEWCSKPRRGSMYAIEVEERVRYEVVPCTCHSRVNCPFERQTYRAVKS